MQRAALRFHPGRVLVLFLVVAVVVATTALLTGRAEAAITTAFSPRFQANANGAILLRGNTNLICDAAATGCSGGQDGVSTGGESLNNNGYVMKYTDTDSDPATFNESTSAVTLPAGSTVLFAGLYFSADPTAGASGAAALSAVDKDKVLFRTPAGAAWNPVTASTLYTSPTIAAYQGFADVTGLVAGAGNGTYAVANIQSGTGKDRYAGWALVLAYQNAAKDMHSLRVFDGFGVVSSGSTQVSIPVTGFQTPQSGTVNAKIGTVVYEGDLGKTGDTLQLDGQSMSDAANPANNFFNSTVSDGGQLINSDRDPGHRNLMGVDVDQFDATGKLGNNVNSATLTLTTAAGGETFYPGVVTFTTDLYAPKLVSTMTGTDLNGGALLPGDVVEYRIAVRNDGTDSAAQTVLTNAVPTHTTFVPGSLTLAGNPITDGTGKFANGTAAWNLGAGATPTAGGTIAYQASTYVTFRVTVDLDTPPGYTVVNSANAGYQGANSGMTITGLAGSASLVVDRPNADLAATLTVGPAVVQRAASPNTVTYTAVVKNNGTDLEPAAQAELTLPAGITAGSLPAGCTTAGQVVTCAVGPLVSGSSATVLIPASADATAAAHAGAGLRVFGAGADAVASNDRDTAALAVNSAPTAVVDTAATTLTTPVTVRVLDNDTDPDDATSTLTVSVSTPAGHGTTVPQPDGTIVYTPAAGWHGTDVFTYRVDDPNGGSATATATVTTANAAPVATDDTTSTPAGTPLTISVLGNDSDPNGDPIHLAATGQPQAGAGTAAISGNAVTYTPTASFAGRATFSYTVEDSQGAQTVAHVFVDVANARPVAADDTAPVAYLGSVTIDVLANDSDNNGDPLTIATVGTPDHGTAVIAAGKITYGAPAGFAGPATFTYTVSDGHGGTDTGHVTVTVANAPPVAADETVHTGYATAVRVNVVADSTDPNGDPLHVSGVTTPAHGTVVGNPDGTLSYTPDATYSGPDTFDYTIDDGQGGLDTGTVNVVVANGVPTAGGDAITASANAPSIVDVLANDADPNGDPLTVTVDTAPQHGTTVVGSDGKVTYTPATGYRGPDSFHYTIADPNGGTAGAMVTITVINSAPTAPPGRRRHRPGDPGAGRGGRQRHRPGRRPARPDRDHRPGARHGGPAQRRDPDLHPGDRFLGHRHLHLHGRRPGRAQRVGAGHDHRTERGADRRRRPVHGPAGHHDDAEPALQRPRPEHRPDPADRLGRTGRQGHGRAPTRRYGHLPAAAGDRRYGRLRLPAHRRPGPDRHRPRPPAHRRRAGSRWPTRPRPPAGPRSRSRCGTTTPTPSRRALTVTAVGTPAHGTARLNNDQTVTYTPAAGYAGTDTFSYEIHDTAGNTATGTVTVRVANAAPVARTDAAAVLKGKHIDLDVLANDTDANPGQTLTVSSVGTPGHGTATVVDGRIRYTPTAGWTGLDTFTYEVSDGAGGIAKSTATVTVSDGDPVALPDTRTTPYRHAVTVPVLTNDFDPGRSLAVTGVGTPNHGTATFTGSTVVYTPPAGFSGAATFSYTATDAAGNNTTATVTITVGTPPVMPDRAVAAQPGTALVLKLPVTDKSGKPVRVLSVGKPKHGTAVLNANGTVTYTAADGFAGIDSFPYTVIDADGNLAAASIKVTVAGPNRPPTPHDDAVRVAAGGSVVIKPLANDADPNDDKVKITKIGKPRHGTAVLSADGTVTYAPNQGYAGGSDSFTYTVSDGRGGTAVATVKVTVTAKAGASGDLAKTGQNLVAVVGAGGAAVLIGGFLYWASLRGGFAIPGLALIGQERSGPGRHRPGRHRG